VSHVLYPYKEHPGTILVNPYPFETHLGKETVSRLRLKSFLRKALTRARQPEAGLTALFIVILSYLILYPLIEMVLRTFIWTERDIRVFRARGAEVGEATLFFWQEMFAGLNATDLFYAPLLNSLLTGGISAALAIAIGGILGWLVTRTDVPGKAWLKPVLTLPYIVPSFAIALAWESLFKSPRYGGVPGLLQAVTGIEPAGWVSHGPFPITVTLAIHYSPFAFLLACAAFASVNGEMEESAKLLGASRYTILRRITLPVIAPALLAAFILAFAKTIGTFSMPYLLGAPVQYHTISTRLYASLARGFDSLAYVMALVLIVITGVVLIISQRLLGPNAKRYQTIGGKGFRSQLTKLGPWRWPIFAGVVTFALITAIFPLGIVAYQTFMGVSGQYGLDNFTLHYWIGESNPKFASGEPGLIHNSRILGATWNTLRLSIFASLAVAAVGLLIGYITVRNRGRWSARVLDQISFVPFLFPGLALAAMYLSLFAVPRGPIPALYGTFALLVLICVVDRLPYGVRMGASAISQIGNELDEAAQLQGATWFQRFRRIILPLAFPGAVSAVMVCFVGLMRELSLFILLITPSTQVLMTLGLQYTSQNLEQFSNAIVLVVAAITVLGEVIIWRVTRTRMTQNSHG
jgi:iron(III) transport system permease protein